MTAMGLDLSLTHSAMARTTGDLESRRTNELRGMVRVDFIREWISLALADSPEVVAIEGYSYGSKGSSLLELAELGGVIRHLCWTAGVDWLDIPPATLKVYATGHGRADKFAMLVAARDRLGYRGTDHNEADAAWLRALALDMLGTPVVDLPQRNRVAVNRGITRNQARISY